MATPTQAQGPSTPAAHPPYAQQYATRKVSSKAQAQAYPLPPGIAVTPPAPKLVIPRPAPMLTAHPCVVQCSTCKQQVETMVEYENGKLTWISIGLICMAGGCFGCCLIPTCVHRLKDAKHICPNCKKILGKYRRMK